MTPNYHRLIANGALVALFGFILSGIAGTALSMWLTPQPAWSSPQVFAQHYHFLQSVPFFFGFALVGGMLMTAVGHFLVAEEKLKSTTLLALILTCIFATLIFFNYIVQTTFVHSLAIHYKPEYDFAVTMFSMQNPTSLCWAIEMWGYAILGVATWLWVPYYRNNTSIVWLLVANGIVSLSGGVIVVIDANWVFTTSGLVAYAGWNLLMIALVVLIYRHAKADGAKNQIDKKLSKQVRFAGD